ncbi:MAG: hypothetical protein ACKKMS_01100 [Candidatus Nealsonbacteria bacterium]
MKKIFSVLVLLSILAFLFFPTLILAQVPKTCKITKTIILPDGRTCPIGDFVSIEDWGACCMLQAIYNVTDWIFVFLLALATVFVIMGAIFLLTAAGMPDRIVTGRNYIIYAMIGLAIGFVAKAVPGIVKLIVGIT